MPSFCFFFLFLFFNSFFWFCFLRWFAGRAMIDWKQASSRLDVQWMDGWMDCIWGWFLLSWEDMMGREGIGCWFWMDGSGRCRFSNKNNKTRHLGIMGRDGGVCSLCVSLFFGWLLLLSGFLLARFVSVLLLGWMDGSAQHNTTPPAYAVQRALAARGMKICTSN